MIPIQQHAEIFTRGEREIQQGDFLSSSMGISRVGEMRITVL